MSFLENLRNLFVKPTNSSTDRFTKRSEYATQKDENYVQNMWKTQDPQKVDTLSYITITWGFPKTKGGEIQNVGDIKQGYLIRSTNGKKIYGLETEDGMSYSAKGAEQFLDDIVARGGYVSTDLKYKNRDNSVGIKTNKMSNDAMNYMLYGFSGKGVLNPESNRPMSNEAAVLNRADIQTRAKDNTLGTFLENLRRILGSGNRG